MARISDNIVVAGIGETTVGKLPGMHPVQIQAWAVRNALADSGLTVRDVDGLVNLDPYATPNSMFGSTLAEYLGLRTRFLATVDVGGTVSILTMMQQAAWAIEAGHCEVAVCVFGENLATVRPPDVHSFKFDNLMGGEEWEEPFGVQGMVIPYALVAQRYIDEGRATPDDFGEVAVVTRRHALLNDNAQMKKPITLEDHRKSRIIASPLRLLDCSLVSDGGGAVVLMSRERARKLGRPIVHMRSLAMCGTHNSVAQLPDIDDFGMGDAARRAFDAAGLGPEDFDVALLHDAFTMSVLLTYEAMGFCKPGDAGAYVRSGAIALGGRCPLNPHGGLLSQAHIGGMLHIVEAVRQLRGEAGRRQVQGARRAVVSGNGGVFSICGVAVFEAGS